MIKFKEKDGYVEYLLKSDKDYVRGNMTLSNAQLIANNGKLVKSELSDYPICIDNEWYFKGSKDIKKG